MLISTLNVSTTVLMTVQSNLAGSVFGKTPTSLKAMCPSSSKSKIPTFSPNLSLFLSAALRPALNYVIFLLCALVTRFLIKLDNAFSKSKFWKIRNWDLRIEILWMELSFWKMKDLFSHLFLFRRSKLQNHAFPSRERRLGSATLSTKFIFETGSAALWTKC